ncbi:hypothetical protein M413DRAFT_12796 [Hebeloma cylindrosporum]|uniref:Methyltransferase domain-containing protein n=1 Tax=Hebeloma cylindrosporum TaxID=76867 RepID=A0A0C3BNR8_HEBCY|nr:hypothetical protein M413DRAFT_12796 [Hebeloma cylindrosporum h7]
MLPRTTSRPPSAQKHLRADEEHLSKGFISRSTSTEPRFTATDFTPSYSSPPFQNPQSIPRTTVRHHPQPRMPLDLSVEYLPMQRSRATYTQSNPPSEKRMNAGTPSSSHIYPSPPNEDFHPPRQVIRLEYSPHENGQTPYYGVQSSTASYVEASYQPPPPVQASYQPPPSPQVLRSDARRALPVPGKTARSSSAKVLAAFPPPPSYPPPSPSATHAISRFLPSPAISPPHSTSPLQPPSRSHSPTSTELPDYSSARIPYSSVQIARPPLQIAINNTSPARPARPEYAQYLETTSYPSPPISRPPQATSSLLHIPDPPVHHLSSSAPTDNERKPWYSGRGNGLSAPSSPARNAFYSKPSPGSSGSSDAQSPTSDGGPSLLSPNFVFPGSRSVARPKASLKIESRSKSQSRKDTAIRSPISDFPHAIPPLPTGLPSPTTVHSGDSTNPMNVLPGFPDTTYSETSSLFSNESGIARARKVSGSSGNTSPVYIFPVGRSRAQPKLVPNGSKGQRSGKSSGGAGNGESEGKRTGFMGMLRKKKKSKVPKLIDGSSTNSSGSSVESESTKETIAPANVTKPENYQVMQATMHEESREQAKRAKSRIGSYPLDPYDSVLLDNDRHTGELLVRLNPTGSPSFHNYGNNPPTSVLDLGCGQGHWVVDAAIAWKGYGTKVTGYDMVDVSRGLLPWAAEQGVIDNIRFVRGNFLKQRLPFNNDSFDLVRMSCLALCITSDSWIFVLQEVARVLMVGGRLELIDDLIFFPYGKASTSLDIPDSTFNAQVRSIAPRLDITIPSAAFSTFSIYDGETNNPGLGLVGNEATEEFYNLYGVEEEDADDTATLNGRGDVQADPSQSPRALPRTRRGIPRNPSVDPRSWTRSCATSGDLEALFEHMLVHKFGINKNPSEFVLGLIQEVFGHAREIKTMHLTLAPPEVGQSTIGAEAPAPRGGLFGRSSRLESMGLSQALGLVLWPSTFIPMEQSEIEIHASKHLRMLLSCKSLLLEHAIEAMDDDEIDEDSMLEAFWEYEGFLRRRFDPPPISSSSSDDKDSDTVSTRGSIAESISSEGLDAMWEIESEFRQRFAWQGSESRDRPETPNTPKLEDNTPTAPTFSSSASPPANPRPMNPLRRDTDASSVAPIYSRDELTHVRTFRVYEAIKFDETIFGSSALGLSGLSLTAPP